MGCRCCALCRCWGGRLQRDQCWCRLSPAMQEPAPWCLCRATASDGGGWGAARWILGASWASKTPSDSMLPEIRVQRVQGWGRDPTTSDAGLRAADAEAGGLARRPPPWEARGLGGVIAGSAGPLDAGRASTRQRRQMGRALPRRGAACRWGCAWEGTAPFLTSRRTGQAECRGQEPGRWSQTAG